jgi:hypothetical protein
MSDFSALYREDATEAETLKAYQKLVDTGNAWRLEGHVGRTAMSMIEAGLITLGQVGHRDYYGNYIPSKYEVEPGTKGSQEYVDKMRNKPNWAGEKITPSMVEDANDEPFNEE